MADVLHLWPEKPEIRDGKVRLSAELETGSGRKKVLWYEVPEEQGDSLSDDTDAFVASLSLRMARERRPVHVHGPVSPSLLRNLEQFLSAWSAWKPKDYAPIEITAEQEKEREIPAAPIQAVCGFSGGVDSSFTAFRHARAVTTTYPEPLTAGVMAHGYDIPLDEQQMYNSAFAKARRQLDSVGLELIPLATNFREFEVDWTHTFGAAVAGTLMLFGRRFHRGLIAQGVGYAAYRVLVEGSNPLTDPLLSSEAFRVVPDGAGFSRADKIQVLAEWPEAMELLRVCWAGEQKDRNCCQCEKCIRNILTFRGLGLGLPPCFDHDVSDRQIRELQRISRTVMEVGYKGIVRLARDRGLEDQSWVSVVRRKVRKNTINQWIAGTPVLRRWLRVRRWFRDRDNRSATQPQQKNQWRQS